MSPEFINQKELSYLRFLINRLIDEDVAGAMLANADLEIILDIQAVMIIGMEAAERGNVTPYDCPESVYEACRRKMPSFDDRDEEIRYLLQPEYKQFLQAGMQALNLC